MSKGKISKKQQEILEYIKMQILQRGFPPAVREICEAVNLKSTSSVHSHLETLEKNGYIRRDPTKPRTIEIVDDSFNLTRREVVNVPLIGSVAAGQPILAEENIENYFPIPVEFLPNESIFMLRVKGEGMINAGIVDGAHVLVKQQNTARNGEIVVALFDDEATLRCKLEVARSLSIHTFLAPWAEVADCAAGLGIRRSSPVAGRATSSARGRVLGCRGVKTVQQSS